jgi:WD40 repeat protein
LRNKKCKAEKNKKAENKDNEEGNKEKDKDKVAFYLLKAKKEGQKEEKDLERKLDVDKYTKLSDKDGSKKYYEEVHFHHNKAVTGITSFKTKIESKKETTVIVTCSKDKTVRLWTVTKLPEAPGIHVILADMSLLSDKKFGDGLLTVACMMVNERPIVAVGGMDNKVEFFDASNGDNRHYCEVLDYDTEKPIEVPEHKDWVSCITLFFPTIFKAIGKDGFAQFFRFGSSRKPPLVLISGGYDGCVRVSRLSIGDQKVRPKNRFGARIARVFDIFSKLQSNAPESPDEASIREDEEKIAKEAQRDTQCLVAYKDRNGKTGHSAEVYTVAYCDGPGRTDAIIFSGDSVGDIFMWSMNACDATDKLSNDNQVIGQVSSLIPLRKLVKSNSEAINLMRVYDPGFSMDPVLITAESDKMLKIWNIETGDLVRKLIGHVDEVLSVEVVNTKMTTHFEPVLISVDVNKFCLWNFQSTEQLRTKSAPTRMNGHTELVNCVHTFNFDARYDPFILSGSNDGTARIFCLALNPSNPSSKFCIIYGENLHIIYIDIYFHRCFDFL